MIKEIKVREQLLAIIIPADYSEKGVNFFTPNHYSQQLAYMNHPLGHKIIPHKHNHIKREVYYTQEVLFIKKGKLRVDFYDNDNNYLNSHVLSKGDIILLISGGHGFEVIEEVEMIEVKQGPYFGDDDKVRFSGIDPANVKIID